MNQDNKYIASTDLAARLTHREKMAGKVERNLVASAALPQPAPKVIPQPRKPLQQDPEPQLGTDHFVTLLASAVMGDISLTSFVHLNAQRKDVLLASMSPPKVSAPSETGPSTKSVSMATGLAKSSKAGPKQPVLFDHYVDLWNEELTPLTDEFVRDFFVEYKKAIKAVSPDDAALLASGDSHAPLLAAGIGSIPFPERAAWRLNATDRAKFRRQILDRMLGRGPKSLSFDGLTAQRSVATIAAELGEESIAYFTDLLPDAVLKELGGNLVEYSIFEGDPTKGEALRPVVKRSYYGSSVNKKIDTVLKAIRDNPGDLTLRSDGVLISSSQDLVDLLNPLLNQLGKRAAVDPKLINRFFPGLPLDTMDSIQRQVKEEYYKMLDGMFNGIDSYIDQGYPFSEALAKGTQDGTWTRAINERASAITARLATEEYARYQAQRLGKTAYKIWETQGDDRVRPKHVELQGEEQPLDHPFSLGIEPGQEWRCRCFLKIVFRDTSKASHEPAAKPLVFEIKNGVKVGPEASWAAQSKANDDKWREWVVGAPKIPDIVNYD